MDFGLKPQQILRRIVSLAAENKELREKHKTLSEAFDRVSDELKQQKKWIEQNGLDNISAKKESGTRKSRFDTVTILFAEIHGFSDIIGAASDTASYMDKLDYFYLRFNEIIEKYKLVKLNSIGDNFMCAGGIPEKNIINPISVTLAALEMLHVVETDAQNSNDHVWKLSIGIHTGSVTTRIGGKKQLSYEVKGDTINVVSRIVSVGMKNTIVVSATTYEFVKELFDCHYTSTLPVKYQKNLELFSVKGINPELAEDENRRLPNDAFRAQFMLVQFSDLQERVLDKLEKELPSWLYYHNVKHTVDVVTESELIGWAEGLNDYQLLMIKTAALFHDTGHTVSYADHEERSVEIAQEILPEYQYTQEEINEVCRIIMATELPPKPADLSEAIICDSDLDYLGRTDFIPVSNALYKELKEQNKTLSLNDWNKQQLKFISSHQYFTKTGRQLREVKKQEQIERIKQLIEN